MRYKSIRSWKERSLPKRTVIIIDSKPPLITMQAEVNKKTGIRELITRSGNSIIERESLKPPYNSPTYMQPNK